MMKEIQYIHTKSNSLLSVYGFGSFFRTDKANDCDLLLVVSDDASNLGKLHADLFRTFFELGLKLSIDFDLTVLTEREHKASPLREHDRLVLISASEITNT
jgi:predicted nucleotidyltransferase